MDLYDPPLKGAGSKRGLITACLLLGDLLPFEQQLIGSPVVKGLKQTRSQCFYIGGPTDNNRLTVS